MLKGLCTQNRSKVVSTDIFANYFKAINNPESVFFKQMRMFCVLMKGT